MGGSPASNTDGCLHFCFQIRRHPSLKKFFYQLPDTSLRKLAATLRRQGACSPEPCRGLSERPYQFAFDLANKYAGRNGHTTLSLMGLRYPQLPHTEALQVRHRDVARVTKRLTRSGHDKIYSLFPPSLPSSGFLGSS